MKLRSQAYGVRSKLKKFVKALAFPYFKYLDKNQQNMYLKWAESNRVPQIDTSDCKVLISVIIPLYNTPDSFFWDMINSVQNQTYSNWEIILVDDASINEDVRTNMKKAEQSDGRIKTIRLEKNHRISGATNAGIRAASGDYCSLLDHDDILHPDALAYVARAIEDNSKVKMIYTDEAKLDENGLPYQPFFKPDWNFDLLRSINYITHFTTIKTDILLRSGGENGKYDGTQDWELFLRVTRILGVGEIYHVPQVLYYWRVHENSTARVIEAKPYVVEAQKAALENDIAERGVDAIVTRDIDYGAQWRVSYNSDTTSVTQFVMDANSSVGDVISEAKEGVVIIIANKDISYNDNYIKSLVGDAIRKEIGFAFMAQNSDLVMHNLKSLLPTNTSNLINKLSRRSFTKHVYLTTKYNLTGEICADVIVVEVEKLKNIPPNTKLTGRDITRELTAKGYMGVYNPYNNW